MFHNLLLYLARRKGFVFALLGWLTILYFFTALLVPFLQAVAK